MTINDLRGLCEYFEVEEPVDLNGAVYRRTKCGASISIYFPSTEQPGEDIEWRAVCERRDADTLKLVALTANGVAVPFEKMSAAAQQMMCWENGYLDASWEAAVEGQDPRCYTAEEVGGQLVVQFVEKAKPVEMGVIHNGDRTATGADAWDIPSNTPIVGFTLQSIVEGSDATVDSDLFVLPVESETVDRWIEGMEREVDWLWRLANLTHYRIMDERGICCGYAAVGWDRVEIDPVCEHSLSDRQTVAIDQALRGRPDGPERIELSIGEAVFVLQQYVPD